MRGLALQIDFKKVSRHSILVKIFSRDPGLLFPGNGNSKNGSFPGNSRPGKFPVKSLPARRQAHTKTLLQIKVKEEIPLYGEHEEELGSEEKGEQIYR